MQTHLYLWSPLLMQTQDRMNGGLMLNNMPDMKEIRF